MCEFSERLVAWLDGELPEGEAEKMERHLGECTQCRGQLDAYRQASDTFEAYSKRMGILPLLLSAAKDRCGRRGPFPRLGRLRLWSLRFSCLRRARGIRRSSGLRRKSAALRPLHSP